MQLAMRRAIAIGGATFVAVGATLALSLPASANTNHSTVSCTDGVATLHVVLEHYSNTKGPNSVTITDASGNNDATQIYHSDDFSPQLIQDFTADGTVAQTFHIKVVPSAEQLKVDQDYTTPPCPSTTTTTTAPPTTTTTASATTTTAPPTTTKGGILPTTVPPTTTAVLAAGTAPLPNTGVSATMPLTIGGALLVAGGGILLWMRMSAKRRRTS
jgi:LPXTG-motif cell wall-anchored protein